MLHIGTHLSSSKGFLSMGKDAYSIQADTFQFFTRNPRGARAKALDVQDMEALGVFMAGHGFVPIVAHAPYTMNACSTNPRIRELAGEMFSEDLSRMEHLPGNYYNFHPGSHLGQDFETAAGYIADMLNSFMKPRQNTTVLLETMAGKGTEIGRSFEELKYILDRVHLQDKIGICFDSCHLSDAGYDIINDLDGVLADFDHIIGLTRLKAFHLNDSLNPTGSHKDRHALIGEGTLGLEVIGRIIKHPSLKHLPFILETPTDLEGHGKEIARLLILASSPL